MVTRGSLLAVLAIQSGCWPYIHGTWDDDDDTDVVSEEDEPATQLVGWFWYRDWDRSYWDGAYENYGGAWWGWLEEPVPGLSARSWEVPNGEGCIHTEPNRELDEQFLKPQATYSIIDGPEGGFALSRNADKYYYGDEIDRLVPNASYELAETVIDDETSVEFDELVVVPASLSFDGPALDGGNSPAPATPDDLVFTWEDTEEVSYVEVIIDLVDETGDSIETWRCIVDAQDEELSLTEWDEVDGGLYWIVSLSAVVETIVSLPDSEGVSRVSGSYDYIGSLTVDH